MNRKRVFITGAGGFIGANLTRALLKKKYDVYTLTHSSIISWRLKEIRKSITLYNGSLTDFSFLEKILAKTNPAYIIHLAAYGSYPHQAELNESVNTNVIGISNLLEASKHLSYKCFINAGSSSEYGRKNRAMKETDSCFPISYYAATKLASTNICKIFSDANNKPIVTLRLFSVYGPYEEPTRFIPTITKSLIGGGIINLTPGDQRRDFIYVDDVSDAFIKTLEFGKKTQGEIFNIGTGKEYTNDDVVRELFNVTKKRIKVKKGTYPKRTWDVPHWKSDITKAKKVLGWNPKHSLKKGLLENYKWFKQNLAFYND